MGSIPCLLYTILCVVFEARVINLCDRDIATNFGAVAGEVILVDFLLRVHCIAPRWSTFQGVSRSVDVILVKDFANSIDILLVWQSFLFWNQISYFNGDVYSSLIVEMKSERCPFSKRPFENQAFFIKDPTHIIRNIQSFDCHVFWKQKLTRCKTKMVFVFHGSLYPF